MRRNISSSAAVALVTTYLSATATAKTKAGITLPFVVVAASFITNTNSLGVSRIIQSCSSLHRSNFPSSIRVTRKRRRKATNPYCYTGPFRTGSCYRLVPTVLFATPPAPSPPNPESIIMSMSTGNSTTLTKHTDETVVNELLYNNIICKVIAQVVSSVETEQGNAVQMKDSQKRILSDRILYGAKSLKDIASSKHLHGGSGGKSKKGIWMSLQRDASSLLMLDQNDKETTTITTTSSEATMALTAGGLFAVLALLQADSGHVGDCNDTTSEEENRSACRAAASATEVIITKHQKQQQLLQHSSSTNNDGHTSPQQGLMENIVTWVIRELLILAVNKQQFVDLHIVTSLARAFGIHGNEDILSEVSAAAIHHALCFDVNMDKNDQDNNGETIMSTTSSNTKRIPSKQDVAGALALAAQLGPWNHVSPVSLVEAAIIPYDLWHQAELICDSASTPVSTTNNKTSEQEEEAKKAIHALIDAALEARSYRRADSFATQFYNRGGKSRYIEARFLHACSTIGKVVRKRQLPIIERQVERVSKAVDQVCGDACTDGTSNSSSKSTTNPTVTTDSSDGNNAKDEIRSFALRQLEEAGEFDSAYRLAQIWGIEYVYDEETVLAAAAARRKRYIQWEDAVPTSGTAVPDLLSTPRALLDAFQTHKFHDFRQGPFGFDVEWGDDHAGADVLQLATTKVALLVDIPALSKTEEGTDALKETVGRLFACPSSIVVGFSCRQDLSRLRSSPCCGSLQKDDPQQQSHWLSCIKGVVDAQVVVSEKEPKLQRLGLSRVCEHYLGKPLDKAEQCSLWTARPLSIEQRVYASLDAWACAAIYEQIFPKSTNSS